MKITNSLSLNMLADLNGQIHHQRTSLEHAKAVVAEAGVESAVGHVDTAAIFASQLGVDVPAVRMTLVLPKGETILVGQYRGPRMPEGAKELPADATIEWVFVTIA